MRVMHLIAPGVLAGAERLVLAGCEALVACGVEIELIVIEETRKPSLARDFVREAEARGLRTKTLVSRGRFDMMLMHRLFLAACQVDLLHVHGFKALVHAQAARLSCPLVVTWHGDTASDDRVERYERMGRFLAQRADRLFVVGRAAQRDALGWGASPKRTVLCENFAPDIEGVVPTLRTRAGVPRLLFAGRLSEEKAPLVLLDALAASSVPFELSIAGDGPLMERVRERIASRKLGARVRLLGWSREVGALMEHHDLLVLPSLREGLPLVVLEAAARGMPMVASDVGAVSDIVVQGETGFLVPAGDVAALRGALDEAARCLDSLSARALALAPTMRDRFGRARWARETEDIYRELTSPPHAPALHANPRAGLRSMARLWG